MKTLQRPEQITFQKKCNVKHGQARLSSMIGLSAGAISWSNLASANDEGRDLQTLILPDTYSALDDGTVILQLETGEQLTLTADQYVMLDGGLLLVVDELAQNSVAELPFLGSLRTQLFTEVQPVRSPDGSIVEASNQQPLWSGGGPAPQLFEEIDIQRFEIAQDQQEEEDGDEGLFLGGAGSVLIGLGVTTLGMMNTGAADDESTDGEGSDGGGSGGGGDTSAISFVSATTAKAFEQSTGTVYTAQAASTNSGSITYSIIGGVDETKFSIDPTTGVLTFVAPPSYGSPTDSGGDNVYDIQIEATDSAGDTAQRSLAVQVLEVSAVPGITGGSMAHLATAMGKLYYSYDDGSDTELWEYDHDAGTAREVQDINPGSANDSDPNTLIEYQGDGGALYFKANDGTNEVVHKYDGSSVTAISSLSNGTYSTNLFKNPIEFNDKLYFINTTNNFNYPNSLNALTEWNGSTATVIAGNTTQNGPNDTDWVVAAGVPPHGSADGQKLYVSAYRINNFNGDQVGQELFYWDANSSAQNLTLAASFNVSANDSATSHSYPQYMIEYDGSLFTRAQSSGTATSVTNGELWEFDPTDNSKTEYEIGSATNNNGLEKASMIVFKDKLYMIGDDDQANTGKELYVFDSSGIPELVMDINLGPGDGFNNAEDPTKKVESWWDPTILNDKLYFIANDGTGSDLWVYDGISDPTKAYDFATTSIQHLTFLTVLDDTLFFLGDNGGAGATSGTIDLWSIG